MGCGGSKQAVAATATSVSYRRLLRTRSGAANSDVNISAALADVAGKVAAAPATGSTAAAVSDVGDGHEEGETEKPAPADGPPGRHSTARADGEGGGGTCTGDPLGGPPGAEDNEKGGGGSVGEGRAHGSTVHNVLPGEQKMMRGAPSKPCDAHDASKPGVVGPRDQEESSSPKRDAQMEDLRKQLQKVEEQLAGFDIWIPEDGHKGDSEKDVMVGETHEEEDPEFIKEPVFEGEEEEEEEEEEFGDAPEVFKEDFSNKMPVYDEYPHDLSQVPSIGYDFSTEGNAAASFLSFGEGGIGDDQIEQVLYQKFVKVRRSKLHGSEEKKRRTHYQLHHKKIRKHTKRRTYKLVR